MSERHWSSLLYRHAVRCACVRTAVYVSLFIVRTVNTCISYTIVIPPWEPKPSKRYGYLLTIEKIQAFATTLRRGVAWIFFYECMRFHLNIRISSSCIMLLKKTLYTVVHLCLRYTVVIFIFFFDQYILQSYSFYLFLSLIFFLSNSHSPFPFHFGCTLHLNTCFYWYGSKWNTKCK